MQLKVNDVQLPAPITFNYEELRAELLEKADSYASLVYTEDQIKLAKEDRANLNRLKKALNDERIKQEKEYMGPFSTFKIQIAEIVSIIDKASSAVDIQVKNFEEKQKQDKLEKIQAVFESINPELHWLGLPAIYDAKWLNSSVSMKSVQDAIESKLADIGKDLAVVRSLPSYAFEAEEAYKQTLDLAKAVSEAHRLSQQAEKKAAWEAEQQKHKAEYEEALIKPVVTPKEVAIEQFEKQKPDRTWICFRVLISAEEAKELGAWMKAKSIQYRSI